MGRYGVEVILGIAAFGLLYPYLIYPVLLALMSRFFARPVSPAESTPSVALLVSAFNEEGRIRDKIANFEALDYPPDRLEMWIGTDGSNDRTAVIIRNLDRPRVRLIERRLRAGKTSVLNDLARRAEAGVFVFTDVNALFRKDAVRQLVAMLADPGVGLVSGRTVILGQDGNAQVEGAYYRLESWLKERESACGWLAGADGAIYAMRSELYRELPSEWINDLAHPSQVVAAGWQARQASLAISEESAGDDAGREVQRQTRITAQAAYLLATQMGSLVRSGRWGMLWVLLSHKWLRWIGGLWMIVGSMAIVALSPLAGFIVGIGLLILLVGWLTGRSWANLPIYFVFMHLAYLQGLWHAIKGERYVVWTPRSGT